MTPRSSTEVVTRTGIRRRINDLEKLYRGSLEKGSVTFLDDPTLAARQIRAVAKLDELYNLLGEKRPEYAVDKKTISNSKEN